jgi:ribosomal subunit interface protein
MGVMHHNLKGTGIDISAEIRTYVEKRLAAIDKLLGEGAARADVELQYLESEEKTYRAEFMLHYAPHGAADTTLRATARGKTLSEAVDIATEELRLELSRAKKKHIHALRRGAGRVKEFLRGWRDRP